MYDDGDVLLFALSAWGETRWPLFKGAFDVVRSRRLRGEEDGGGFHHARERWKAARLLARLGHCDIDYLDEPARIVIAPSILATLPIAGVPRAVLCGSRSPATIEALRREGKTLAAADELRSQEARA